MGNCECNNPMDFGNEINADDKEEKSTQNNRINQKKANISDYEKTNLEVVESNEYKPNKEKQILNTDNSSNPNKNNIYFSQGDQMQQYNKENRDGSNILRARYDSQSKINNNYNNNNFNYEQNLNLLSNADKPLDNFSKYIFDKINNIRENPQSFIPIIERAKSHITHDRAGTCIYKSSVKVALSRGEPAFDEAINYLRSLEPMNKLIFSPDLVIIPPNDENALKDKTYMSEKINEKVQQGIYIRSFWRDIIRDSETCLLLTIVDDTGANSGKKRNDILDPSMQGIGIASRNIGKIFASYIVLC
jgi:hypothetical protein